MIWLLLALGVRAHLIAENCFLRHQIQLLQARERGPSRTTAHPRLIMALTSGLFAWRSGLLVDQAQPMIRWQHPAFRQYWRAKSARPGRPPIHPRADPAHPSDAEGQCHWGHSSLGPGILAANEQDARAEVQGGRKELARGRHFLLNAILGSLHHEYHSRCRSMPRRRRQTLAPMTDLANSARTE